MKNISNRDHVVQVVSEMFLKHGFNTTSMDDVVKQSGVSKSNIYYHFKSKDELALAVLEANIAMLDGFYEQASGETGAVAKLRRYTELLIGELTGRDCAGGCPLMSLMVEAGKTNEAVRMRLERFFHEQSEQATALLEEGARQGEIRRDLPARILASLFLSWLEGALMMAGIRKDASALQQERDALLVILKASLIIAGSEIPG